MTKDEKLLKFYTEKHRFKEGVNQLRELALKTELVETFKWNFPTYTINTKNIVAICKFKSHFGLWFFNGVFLSDKVNLLENAQEGKTKAMRHWKFNEETSINHELVDAYIREAIANQKKGLQFKFKKQTKNLGPIPNLLKLALNSHDGLKTVFQGLSESKKCEYVDYIDSARQEKTKRTRINKITPLILESKGLHNLY